MPENDGLHKYPPLLLGGETYRLRFTLREIQEYEEETGLTIIPGLNGENTALLNRKAKNLLRLAVAGIRGGSHPDMTMEQLAASVDLEELPRVAAVVDLALLKVFPQLKKALNELRDASGNPRNWGDQIEQAALRRLNALEAMTDLPVAG